MNLSLVIPVYDEEENLVPLFDAIRAAMAGANKTWEVIFVDDGSTDNSLSILKKLAADDTEHVRVVVFRRNFGQTAAITAGIDYSRGEIIILMDADLQNDPNDIPMMLSKLDEGYDVVSGWRKNRQDRALLRKFPSRIANWLMARVSGVSRISVPLRYFGEQARAKARSGTSLRASMPGLWPGGHPRRFRPGNHRGYRS